MAVKNIDWCRIVMNEQTKKIVEALDYKEMSAFEISGRSWKRFPFKGYTYARFPEFDICNIPPATEKFDIVIAEQVFEHVRYPNRALENVKSMLNTNGYFLITTPFLIKVHGSPVDYWRWTKEGMCYFLEDHNFTVCESGSWGNYECVKTYLKFETMPEYDSNLCSLDNELDFPIMVWALAKKNV